MAEAFLQNVQATLENEASDYTMCGMQDDLTLLVRLHGFYPNPNRSRKEFLKLMKERFPGAFVVRKCIELNDEDFYQVSMREPEAAFHAAIKCWLAPIKRLRYDVMDLAGYKFEMTRTSPMRIQCDRITDPMGNRYIPKPGMCTIDGTNYKIAKGDFDAVIITFA
jgi:hypothetical protein